MPAQENKAVVRRYFEEFHTGRAADILEQIVAPDLLGPTREATERLLAAFPDYRFTIDAQVAEGDLVATVWTGTGTHEREWASPLGAVEPTGRPVTWTATTTLRLADGKIAAVVGTNWDHLGILQQLGVVAPTAPRSGARSRRRPYPLFHGDAAGAPVGCCGQRGGRCPLAPIWAHQRRTHGATVENEQHLALELTWMDLGKVSLCCSSSWGLAW